MELVDRKPSRLVRITFDILTFDDAGRFDSQTFLRQQSHRVELVMMPGGKLSKAECGAVSVARAGSHFAAHESLWVPSKGLARALQDAALERMKCLRL